jgi:hypothetical protein
VVLLAVLIMSYRQVIAAFPDGGGAYAVAKTRLGRGASLVAAASLVVDYVLNVAVAVAAGVAALTSAFPVLLPYTVELCLAVLVVITAVNLRGVAHSARVFMAPTVVFVAVDRGCRGGRVAAAVPPPTPPCSNAPSSTSSPTPRGTASSTTTPEYRPPNGTASSYRSNASATGLRVRAAFQQRDAGQLERFADLVEQGRQRAAAAQDAAGHCGQCFDLGAARAASLVRRAATWTVAATATATSRNTARARMFSRSAMVNWWIGGTK